MLFLSRIKKNDNLQRIKQFVKIFFYETSRKLISETFKNFNNACISIHFLYENISRMVQTLKHLIFYPYQKINIFRDPLLFLLSKAIKFSRSVNSDMFLIFATKKNNNFNKYKICNDTFKITSTLFYQFFYKIIIK